MDTAALLADPAATCLDRIRPSHGTVTLVVKNTAPLAGCPRCHRRSARVHSREAPAETEQVAASDEVRKGRRQNAYRALLEAKGLEIIEVSDDLIM